MPRTKGKYNIARPGYYEVKDTDNNRVGWAAKAVGAVKIYVTSFKKLANENRRSPMYLAGPILMDQFKAEKVGSCWIVDHK